MTNHLWVCRETNASGFLKEGKKKKQGRRGTSADGWSRNSSIGL